MRENKRNTPDQTSAMCGRPIKIMILAGEISGDMYGAGIMKALKAMPGFETAEFFGFGGDLMRGEGAELFADVSQTGVMGIWEVAKRWRFFNRLFRKMRSLILSRRPDILLTIDYPGFNMRMAAAARRLGVRTVHYVCPQVWAWRRGRIPSIARALDRLICIFPFEPELFEGTGLTATFAGHPLVDCVAETLAEPDSPDVGWGEGLRIALLPGSRKTEISKLMPDLAAAAKLIEERAGKCSFIIPVPRALADFAEKELAAAPVRPADISIRCDLSRRVLAQSRAAIVKSGTSTLECSLAGCPFIVVYKVSAVTYVIGRLLVKGIRNVGMVNILAGKEICPELLQDAVRPDYMASLVCELLKDGPSRTEMLRALSKVNDSLGAGGALKRAAGIVAEEVRLARGGI